MRIWDDTKQNINFVIGDEKKAAYFKKIDGEAEFKDNEITLTSEPKSSGILKLIDSENYNDVNINVDLDGNIIGSQSVYIRSDDKLDSGISVELNNYILSVTDKDKSDDHIYELDLKDYYKIEKDEYDIKDKGNLKLGINIKDELLKLYVDDEKVGNDIIVTEKKGNGIYLESRWQEYGYSQRNISDDVYDGVFKDFKVTDLNEKELYSNELKGIDKIELSIKNTYERVLNWFIKYL